MAKKVNKTSENEISSVPFEPPFVEAEVVTSKINDELNILNSKRYVKGAITYQSPIELYTPVINIFENSQCEIFIKGSEPVKNANEDGTENESWGRVNILGKFEIDEELFYEVGVMSAFDLSVPKIKLYRGAITKSCMNLNIWGADDILKIDSTQGINMEVLRNYVQSVSQKIEESKERISIMKSILVSRETAEKVIGKILFDTVEKKRAHGTTSLVQGVQELLKKGGKYDIEKEGFNAWNLYNALTENFNDKVSAFDIPEKTFSIYNSLSLHLN